MDSRIRHHCPTTPIILVGTKLDIRNTDEYLHNIDIYVSHNEGMRIAQKIHALKYVECSAKTQEGLSRVFEEAIRAALVTQKNQDEHRKHCRLW